MRRVAPHRATLRRARLLVLDVDGVLTDGRLYYGPDGEMLKAFHVRDGFGLKQVMLAGIAVAIISGRRSKAVKARARELGIGDVIQGASEKLPELRKLIARRRVSLAECVCVGDDTPDVPLLRAAGVGVAVADAHADARGAADLITLAGGGRGAVREVCDWLVGARVQTPRSSS